MHVCVCVHIFAQNTIDLILLSHEPNLLQKVIPSPIPNLMHMLRARANQTLPNEKKGNPDSNSERIPFGFVAGPCTFGKVNVLLASWVPRGRALQHKHFQHIPLTISYCSRPISAESCHHSSTLFALPVLKANLLSLKAGKSYLSHQNSESGNPRYRISDNRMHKTHKTRFLTTLFSRCACRDPWASFIP